MVSYTGADRQQIILDGAKAEGKLIWYTSLSGNYKEIVEALRAFDDPVYLHQTIELYEGRLTRFLDLPMAVAAWEKNPIPCEWRVHFHVPVFLDEVNTFRTTRPAIEEALKVHKASPLSAHIEIETYTWDVLPESLKTGDIVDYVVRELEWVRDQLV